MTQPPTPAGWYLDTSVPGTERYWDGQTWTQHVRALGPGPLGAGIGAGSAAASSTGAGMKAKTVTRFLTTHPTRRRGWNWSIWAVVVLLIVGTVSNAMNPASDTTKNPIAAGVDASTATSTQSTASSSAPSSTTAKAAPSPTVTHSPAATASRKPASIASPIATGGQIVSAAGAVLPNHFRTPGAVNPDVSQADIHSTICVVGWTTTIRPPSSYTTSLKERQLATGYAYRGDVSPSDYEEDHLIPLELGGSPGSELNLWPEPQHTTDNAATKDKIENKLHTLVCDGQLALATAQHAIAANWYTAYLTYYTAASSSTSPRTTAASSSVPAPPPPTTAAPTGCYPRTNAGGCYKPGQICRTGDRGTTGMTAGGQAIKCEETTSSTGNVSWRWVAI